MTELSTVVAAAKLLAVRSEPYLGAAAHAVSIVETPGLEKPRIDQHWRLYVDPAQVAEWAPAQWSAVMRAEIRRVLLDHGGRAKAACVDQAKMPLWVRASDLVVCTDVSATGAEWPFDAPDLADVPGTTSAMSVEEVFALLDAQGLSFIPQEAGSATTGVPGWWESPPDAECLSPAESASLMRQVARDVAAADPSPVLKGWAGNFGRPQLDWRKVLDAEVSRLTSRLAGQRDYSYSRINHRTRGTRVILPGMVGPEPPAVTVIRDTSRSMQEGSDRIEAATAEVSGIISAKALVTLLDVDDQVHTERRVRHGSQLNAIAGGGGTDMAAGLHAVATRRPQPHLVVVITDGETSWPERNPLRSTVLIVLVDPNKHSIAAAPRWARVVTVKVQA